VDFDGCCGVERESALLSLLVQMDGIHGHLEQVGVQDWGFMACLVCVGERAAESAGADRWHPRTPGAGGGSGLWCCGILRVVMVVECFLSGISMVVERERESALLNLLVQMDSIHGHLEQVGFRTVVLWNS
jgi:hypothetical protein